MELYLLCFFAFLAGFIDSIVGGGGLVQVPAFFVLYPQLSVPNIIGKLLGGKNKINNTKATIEALQQLRLKKVVVNA